VSTQTFILNHGAFHDSSAWAEVVTRLQARGHTADAPCINAGRKADEDGGYKGRAQLLADYIVQRDLTDVVLVGHSAGGITVCKTVELVPERVRRLVFCSAFILADGQCLTDNMPPESRQLLEQLARSSFDQRIIPPFALWRELFMNDADLDVALSTYDQLIPMEYQLFRERIDLKTFYTLTTPRSYVLFTEDTALPSGEWSWHPRMTSRLGMYRFLQMPGGHEVMFTNPDGLAAKIIQAGRD
jgi:pimeloyl-ACP methyl ester carboxylesterase